MRLRKSRVLVGAFLTIILYILYKEFNLKIPRNDPKLKIDHVEKKNDRENVTVIILEFESFDNDVPATVLSVLSACPVCKVLVVSEELTYPPLRLPEKVQHVVLQQDIYKTLPNIKSILKDSDYVLYLPDGGRISSLAQVEDHVRILKTGRDFDVLALGIGALPLNCYKYALSIRSWSLDITPTPQSEACDGVSGRAALLLPTNHLLNLTYPFARPNTLSLNLQGVVRRWKIHIGRGLILGEGRQLYASDHLQWKHETLQEERIKQLYKNIGIKKVVDSNHQVHWYGCKRTTSRCFPTVVDDTPSYLYEGRWTPPCCLEALRITARHVFQTLRSCHVRWWLEGGSLLGAVRSGDIIPWDYDVDIGMYEKDLDRCPQLKSSRWQTLEDSKGFVWQKASNGNFFQVHYSTSNHLHVDIFPFRAKDGMMIRGSWSLGHRQDVDFPEHFLKPFSALLFAGVSVSVPNNVRDFLEFKFGMGVIEHPKYPNPETLTNSTIRKLDLESIILDSQ